MKMKRIAFPLLALIMGILASLQWLKAAPSNLKTSSSPVKPISPNKPKSAPKPKVMATPLPTPLPVQRQGTLWPLARRKFGPLSVAVSPDGTQLFTGIGGGTLWKIKPFEAPSTWLASPASYARWSPTGERILLTSGFDDFAIYDASGQRESTQADYPSPNFVLREAGSPIFSPDGQRVAFRHSQQLILETKEWVLLNKSSLSNPRGRGFNSRNELLRFDFGDARISRNNPQGVETGLVSVATRPNMGWDEKGPEHFEALAFSPDGNLVACDAGPYSARNLSLVSTVTGKVLTRTPREKRQPIGAQGPLPEERGAAFSIDGRLLYVAHTNGWSAYEVPSGRLLRVARFEGELLDLAISGDGSKVLTAHSDGSFALWNGQQGRIKAILWVVSDANRSVNWMMETPQGKWAASEGIKAQLPQEVKGAEDVSAVEQALQF